MLVDYVSHMGDDLMVVNAARVSFDKHHSLFEEEDAKLIRYLAKHNHWTPFGHPTICLCETVPIWIARQRMRSNIGFVYNEVSRRYVDDAPLFYRPKWYARVTNLKQGSASFEVEDTKACDIAFDDVIETCSEAYALLLSSGVAPEQARAVLPVATYTSYYVTGSLAAWARIHALRADSHASKEMQEMAGLWDKIIRPLFPHSWGALVDGFDGGRGKA